MSEDQILARVLASFVSDLVAVAEIAMTDANARGATYDIDAILKRYKDGLTRAAARENSPA